MRWKTAITTEFQKKCLMKGTLLAFLGAAVLCYAAIYLSPKTLEPYGFWIYLLGFILITSGLLPLRRLQKLSQNPYQLYFENDKSLILEKSNQRLLAIPLSSIAKISYGESGSLYGLAIQLNENLPEKIWVGKAYQKEIQKNAKAAKKFNAELFLPYFTKRCFQELESHLAF